MAFCFRTVGGCSSVSWDLDCKAAGSWFKPQCSVLVVGEGALEQGSKPTKAHRSLQSTHPGLELPYNCGCTFSTSCQIQLVYDFHWEYDVNIPGFPKQELILFSWKCRIMAAWNGETVRLVRVRSSSSTSRVTEPR